MEPHKTARAHYAASQIAPVEGRLSSPAARIPAAMTHSTGITIKGRTVRSFAYTTDAVIIRNTNADAILAVYPFTGEPIITEALLKVAQAPLFVGVGGGTTTGQRVIELAMMAEMQGVAGVVLNSPAPAETVLAVLNVVDVPVVATVTAFDEVTIKKIEAGASIVNVAAGAHTAEVVSQIRTHYPMLPILASGGRDETSMLETIHSGANALTWTPPSAQDLQHQMMENYRAGKPAHHHGSTGPGEASAQRATRRSLFPVDADDARVGGEARAEAGAGVGADSGVEANAYAANVSGMSGTGDMGGVSVTGDTGGVNGTSNMASAPNETSATSYPGNEFIEMW